MRKLYSILWKKRVVTSSVLLLIISLYSISVSGFSVGLLARPRCAPVSPRSSFTSRYATIGIHERTGASSSSLFLASSGGDRINVVSQSAPISASDKFSLDDSKSSVRTLTFNLAKSIVGSGILSLPAGLAAFSNSPNAVYPGAIALMVMGMMSAYGFSAIGRACSIHGARTYGEAWQMSTKTQWSSFIPLVIALKTIISCVCYSMIIGMCR
jgi:hypothetical protein